MRVSVAAEAKTLVAFRADLDLNSVVAQDARPTIVTKDAASVLQVVTGHEAPWPGITLRASEGKWDLSAYSGVTVNVTNSGAQPVIVHLRVDCTRWRWYEEQRHGPRCTETR